MANKIYDEEVYLEKLRQLSLEPERAGGVPRQTRILRRARRAGRQRNLQPPEEKLSQEERGRKDVPIHVYLSVHQPETILFEQEIPISEETSVRSRCEQSGQPR